MDSELQMRMSGLSSVFRKAGFAMALASLSQLAPAQGVVPPAWQNLTDFGEIPYTAGGIPASGPIDSPLEDADYIAFAQNFWSAVDTGDSSGLTNFQWSAPDLVSMEQGFPGVRVDQWGGGLELFESLYQHRIQPWNPAGPANIYDLIETDPLIAVLFKHWTLYHQLATSNAWDVVAHTQHINMLVEAYTNGQTTSVRGVPFLTAATIISDRLELEVPSVWFAPPPPAPSFSDAASDAADQAQAQACVDSMKCNIKSMPYKADDYGFLGFGQEPGFDCDDYADAMGAGVSKGKRGVTASTVRMTWKKGKGKAAHQITKISAGGKYWLMDGAVGSTSGPHDEGTPMDGTPLLSGPGGNYPHEPGSVKTGQSDRPIGDRPWSEPGPWNESGAMQECFAIETGLDPGDYVL